MIPWCGLFSPKHTHIYIDEPEGSLVQVCMYPLHAKLQFRKPEFLIGEAHWQTVQGQHWRNEWARSSASPSFKSGRIINTHKNKSHFWQYEVRTIIHLYYTSWQQPYLLKHNGTSATSWLFYFFFTWVVIGLNFSQSIQVKTHRCRWMIREDGRHLCEFKWECQRRVPIKVVFNANKKVGMWEKICTRGGWKNLISFLGLASSASQRLPPSLRSTPLFISLKG
jgi:hypothetical protein